jgi:hypothetical protein
MDSDEARTIEALKRSSNFTTPFEEKCGHKSLSPLKLLRAELMLATIVSTEKWGAQPFGASFWVSGPLTNPVSRARL